MRQGRPRIVLFCCVVFFVSFYFVYLVFGEREGKIERLGGGAVILCFRPFRNS